MSAIYFHIPFCKRLCGYCDFFKSVKLKALNETLQSMSRELESEHSFLHNRTIETIYFGGGTPSLAAPDKIKGLINQVRSLYDVSKLSEVTLEANPDDITREYLEALRAAGVNRLSIGIQSFCDEELKFMNRRHNSAQAIEAVRLAQEVGFDNITIDLIFGVDGFGIESLNHSIDVALSLDVQHISAYHLTIESGTAFGRKLSNGEISQVAEGVSEEEYLLVHNRLVEAGFEHYEISNFAKPNFRSRHNSSYWHGVEYLGIGAGAHSFNGDTRRITIESIEDYNNNSADIYEIEELTTTDHYNELVMTSLRCTEGIDLKYIKTNFHEKYTLYIMGAAQSSIEAKHLVIENDRMFIPTEHFLLSDTIIESLFFEQ